MNELERKIYNYNLEVIRKFKDRSDLTEAQKKFYLASVEYVKNVDEKKTENVFYTPDVPLEEKKLSVFKPMLTDKQRAEMQEQNARYERNNLK